jgi:hypothetical protein
MAQPWPEPDDRHLPVRVRLAVWDGKLCGPDGALRDWLEKIAGRHNFALTHAGIRGRHAFYVMLPSFVLARLLLEEWEGRVAVDMFARPEEGLAVDSDEADASLGAETTSGAGSR